MNGLLIYSRIEKNLYSSGEAKKVMMQVEALNNIGMNFELFFHDRTQCFNKFMVRIPLYEIYGASFRRKLLIEINRKNINVIYIRKDIFDRSLIYMMKKIKQKYPEIIILVEIPTYPYDEEWRALKDRPMLWKDRIARKYIQKYVDRIINYSDEPSLFGIKTINIDNAINTDHIPLRKPINSMSNDVVLLGVAGVSFWHGYDRVLYSMGEYYRNKLLDEPLVTFHIVGEGAALPELKRICKEQRICEHVVFHGNLYGQQLDEMFDKATIGVAGLGGYRRQSYKSSTLKIREYIARGLPFISAEADSTLEKYELKYVYQVQNNNSKIDMYEIIKFNLWLKEEGFEKISGEMSDYAKEYLSWDIQMSKVKDYIIMRERMNDKNHNKGHV